MATNGRAKLSAAWTIVAICVAVPAAARAELGREIEGTYLFAGGAPQRAAHRAALDATASQLTPILRPLGRSTLERYLGLPQRIVVSTAGDQLAIAVHPFPPRMSRLDGSVVRFRGLGGKASTLRRVIEGRTVVETARGEGNTRSIRYSFDETLQRLTVSWNVTIPQYFSRPIRFTLSYRRQ